ncbi:MAG TPA: DUF1444 family protein [Thermoanaerobaculia bacterium]|nr:DUF1444 family protein [Thermoanaerobaculia bacterium]
MKTLFGTPSQNEFAERLVRAFRERGLTQQIDFDEATFSLRLAATEERDDLLMALGNYYRAFARAPRRERDAIIASIVEEHLAGPPRVPKNFSEARHRLLPAIRSRCYYPFSALAAEANGMSGPHLQPLQTIASAAGVSLVLDYPNSMRFVDPEMLSSWGVSGDEAMHVAVANLRARTEPQFDRIFDGLWASAWNDTYDATRLLLDDVVTSVSVRGRHVAFIPHRGLLLVTGDEDAAALDRAATIIGDSFDEAQVIAAVPLVFDGMSWSELFLPPSHPAAPALRRVELQMIASEYAEQKTLLEAVAERRGDDRYVATFSAMRDRDTDALSSYTTWAENLPQLLPKADRIGFVRSRGGHPESAGFAEWDDVVRVMGWAMKPTNDYPVRYDIQGFPTDEQLSAMGVS